MTGLSPLRTPQVPFLQPADSHAALARIAGPELLRQGTARVLRPAPTAAAPAPVDALPDAEPVDTCAAAQPPSPPPHASSDGGESPQAWPAPLPHDPSAGAEGLPSISTSTSTQQHHHHLQQQQQQQQPASASDDFVVVEEALGDPQPCASPTFTQAKPHLHHHFHANHFACSPTAAADDDNDGGEHGGFGRRLPLRCGCAPDCDLAPLHAAAVAPPLRPTPTTPQQQQQQEPRVSDGSAASAPDDGHSDQRRGGAVPAAVLKDQLLEGGAALPAHVRRSIGAMALVGVGVPGLRLSLLALHRQQQQQHSLALAAKQAAEQGGGALQPAGGCRDTARERDVDVLQRTARRLLRRQMRVSQVRALCARLAHHVHSDPQQAAPTTDSRGACTPGLRLCALPPCVTTAFTLHGAWWRRCTTRTSCRT